MAEGNSALADTLRRAGMNPRQLAVAINRRLEARGLSKRCIDVTAPYSWVRRGYKPYDPIPPITAQVLSEQLGYPVAVEELWPDHRSNGAYNLSAADGLDTYTSIDDIVQAISELTALTAGIHAGVTAATGPDLAAAVHTGLSAHLGRTGHNAHRDRVLMPQVDLIAAHVTALRRLDDRHGGGALSLRYATGQLRAVVDLVQSANYEPAVGHRLMTIVADVSQLVGWIHFDAERYGAAERYLLLSARVARNFGESGRAANAIGMLSYVAAFAGHGREAMQIASHAQRICPHDPVLRARIAGRTATAAAVAGDLSGFRVASENARQLLADHQSDGAPSYLYYLEPEQLTAEAGQALVALAERTTVLRKSLLREAIALLTPISEVGRRPDYPRSALLHGSFLTKAHLLAGDLDAATQSARAALTRLSEVQSIRGITYLRALRTSFARRKRSEVISDFLPEFDAAISQHDH